MMVAKISQKEEILQYLHQIDPQTGKRRGLSPLEAIGMFRCYRLAARIGELKNEDGYPITTEIRKDAKGKTYARYFLSRV